MGNIKNAGEFGLNESYVEILRSQWLKDPSSVSAEWQDFFSPNKAPSQPLKIKEEVTSENIEKRSINKSKTEDNVKPLLGIQKKIAANMEDSLTIPTATSVRQIPVKVLEENRLIINQFLSDDAKPRCSFTHIIAYLMVKAIKKYPFMNASYEEDNKNPAKIEKSDINLGIAIDLPGRDGNRSLVVPNIKSAQDLNFIDFFDEYNTLIDLAHKQKLDTSHFSNTTITLTNPGGLGTMLSSPRLMRGQGAIIAVGAIGYPAEYEAASPETLQSLGVGKIMTISSTYDHRIIQGAESGKFLSYLHELLVGEDGVYEEIFEALKIPHQPYHLRKDQAIVLGQQANLTQTERAMKVGQLIHAYRVRGYLLSYVDPLHLIPRHHPDLDLHSYGLTIWDLDRTFDTMSLFKEKTAPFRSILQRLRDTYCRGMGVEYMYINDIEKRNWVQTRVEQDTETFDLKEKKQILSDLIRAEGFEHFLHKRYVGHKRFSVEGAETVISVLREVLDRACMHGCSDAVIGMAHRGRLNVLANVVGKPYEAIFGEFDDIDPRTFQGSGDVKYHMGAKGSHGYIGKVFDSNKEESRTIRIELACNPSHLEAVNPIVEGIVRAKQDLAGDREREKIVPILLHGDAAFAAQGVVYETLQLSGLNGYRTGGTIHIIINNQIGYTTGPERARTSLNCSDIGRALFIPVFRANADNPEACIKAIRAAFDYKVKFKSDVILDLVCYRRHGHNEGDEPSFTQPILYKAIKEHPSVATLYSELLLRRGDISKEDVAAIENSYSEKFEKALSSVREKGHNAFGSEYVLEDSDSNVAQENPKTRVSKDVLLEITERTTHEPEQVKIHPRVKELVLDKRRSMFSNESHKIDFGAAEILAFGSLLKEGIAVRLSGQDCGRGTFAHRHAILYDINDGRPYIPLNHLQRSRDEGEEEWRPSRFRVYDSPLSEEAVLGFEYGYSVSHPSSLVLWEAQFGDFFNGAQIQIDQFIASSEEKWGQKSRLVMMLPHGYDGQGPEHSSGRIERFLQLAAQNNLRVCICSTAAQHFHLLRKQALQRKKPLILFTHKSLLRAEEAASSVDELALGEFFPVIKDEWKDKRKKPDRIIFVSGKIYWDLIKHQKNLPEQNVKVMLVRVEQLYPFPKDEIMEIINKYPSSEIVWLQEEPRNNGAYLYIKDKLNQEGVSVRYIGRAESASPATGSPKVHKFQQATILEKAFARLEKPSRDVEVR